MDRVTLGRFLDKVIFSDTSECWNWTAAANNMGYGVFRKDGKNVLAHRTIYEVLVGQIPDGLNLLHSCDNPLCCNPRHLNPGTQKDNVHDAMSKGRNSKPPIRVGEKNNKSKLREFQIIEIRNLISENKHTHRKIAHMYGVSAAVISNIGKRRTWNHVL